MQKIYFVILFFLATLTIANAQQVIYSQTFEDTSNLFQNYVLANLDKGVPTDIAYDTLQSVAWYVRTAGTGNNHAAVATSDYNPAVAADDWFITPAIRLGKASKLTWKSMSFTDGKPDTYQVYVSTTEQSVSGCLFNEPSASFTSENSGSFISITLDLAEAGYANRVVFIGFRLNTTSGGDKLAIDDIKVTEDSTQFVSLKFIVNMSNYIADSLFSPRTDTVDIAGNFNNFEGTKNILSIVPGTDSSIYATIIPGFLPGDRLEFKFRINSTWDDSIVEFPYGLPNRVWIVEKDKYTYTCYYNDQGSSSGVPENGIMDKVKVFPNPAQSIVAVELPDDIRKMFLMSLTGTKIFERETSAGSSVTLDVSSLAKGTYLLLFYTQQGFAGSKKLVKN